MGDLRPTALDIEARRDDSDRARINASSPGSVTVLVTGFGRFKDFKNNTSWLIAQQLEHILPPILDPNNPSRRPGPTIHVFVHPEEVRVSYPTVFSLIPQIISSFPVHIDYILNIGMAAGRKYYSVESQAHRDGYKIRDVDGNLPTAQEKYWRDLVECPEIMKPDLNTEEVFARWKSNVDETTDVRVSTDAGRYLCDFMFYTSLATRKARGEAKKVLFLHVPGESDKASIEKGALVASALIRAMVASGTDGQYAGEITYAEDAANGDDF